jgi:hypothetical protein
MQLIEATLLLSGVLSCSASPLFKRQDSSGFVPGLSSAFISRATLAASYPDPSTVGPTPSKCSLLHLATLRSRNLFCRGFLDRGLRHGEGGRKARRHRTCQRWGRRSSLLLGCSRY